ncbi:MAG: DUF490 domain-containing protein, partial [Paracoccus sp. (in: a-proteobacteria)]|nr:DUF490 domain-containing protein [Paracoccus sp. (in: a-proteobacteria)]
MWYRIFVLIALLLTLPPAVLAQDDPDAGASAAEISSAEPDDQGFLTRFLQSRLSNAGRSVQIDGFHGALSSRATFERITIADADGVWLTLHDGAIQWNRSALLRGQVQVGELTAALIEIPRAPLSGEREQQERRSQSRSFELPELPVGIHIDRIDASRVVLGSPLLGEEAVISVTGEMSLAGGEGTADVVISRTDGKKGKFVFDGSFDNTTRVLNIDLSLDEAAGGIFARTVGIEGSPAVMATIAGEGPLSDYQADIQIATDGIDRISGHLSFAAADDSEGTPGNRFELEVGGDLATLLPPQNREFFGDSTLIVAQGWRAGTGRMEIEALRLDTDALKINGRMSTNDQNAPQVLDLTVDFGQQAGAQTLPVRIPFMNPPISVLSGNLAIGYDATQGSDWRLKGWLTEIDRAGLRLARLDLDGAGHVALTADEALEQVDGNLGFDASGISLVSARMQQVVGDRISGRTGFDFTPGQVVTFSDMQIEGGDYGLEGRLTVDGLTSGIVLSSDHVIARHDDLSKLSDFAGRPLSGRARAELAGFFQLLTGAFDIDGVVTGTDISVNSKRIDHLLAGDATIELSAGRTDDGTDLRELTVTAQRITLGADGFIWDDHVDLTVDFNVPTLADLDPDFQGELSATARLAGAPGSRRITLEGEAQGLRTGVAALDGAFAGETSLSARLSEDARGGFDLNELRLGNEQLDLTGSGTIAGAAVNADFDLNFKDIGALGESFAGAAQATARIVTEAGQRRILVNGSGRNLSVGQADLDAALAGETRLSLTAAQGNDQITISDARLENDQFSATATGTVSGAGMNIQAQAAVPAMAALGRGWHGSLSADAVMTQGPQGTRNIRIDAVGQDLALGQQNLDGALGGRTDITLLAEQAAQGGVLTLKSLDIRNPQLTANAQGTLDAGAVNGQAGAQIADLAALGRGWSGSLNADARLTTAADGTRRVEIDGSGQDIRLGQAQADAALTGTTTIDILAEQAGDGAIRIERAEVVNDQLNASAQGEIGQTRTDATGRLNVRDLASLGLGLQGALDLDAAFADVGDGARRLRVTGTGQNLALGQQGNAGRLSGTTDIGIDAVERDGTYTIERAELTNDQTHIQAEGSIGPAGTDARAVMDMRDLAALGLGMGGALKAEASLRDDGTGSRAF